MKEYRQHIDHYRWEGFHAFSNRIPHEEWGNTEEAKVYMGKYWLDSGEFNQLWLPIMDKVFATEAAELPDMMFRTGFQLIPQVGGAVFVEEEFELLKACMKHTKDKFFVVIENALKNISPPEDPPFRMKYPADIKWAELMSGNYISSMIFEASMKSYFVFGDSGLWGKYSATDYSFPLDIIGFQPDYAQIFSIRFKLPDGDNRQNVKEWLPTAYKLRLPPDFLRSFEEKT